MSSGVVVTCAAALLGMALIAVGCAAAGANLEGTQWVLEGWSVSSQDPTEFETTASFADGEIGGRAAVNSYGGPYTAGADGSFSTGEIVQTLMAGSEAAMRAEQTYFELLSQARRYEVDGDTLTLFDEDGTELLIFGATE